MPQVLATFQGGPCAGKNRIVKTDPRPPVTLICQDNVYELVQPPNYAHLFYRYRSPVTAGEKPLTPGDTLKAWHSFDTALAQTLPQAIRGARANLLALAAATNVRSGKRRNPRKPIGRGKR